MLKVNFRKKSEVNDNFASEVVEIIEEKLDEKKIHLPLKVLDKNDSQLKFRKDLRNELIYEISDFISSNKKKLNKKVA